MRITDYFVRACKIENGFPLNTLQVETLFPGKFSLITRKAALDPHYVVNMGWLVKGLDVETLRVAAMAIVKRHAALRSWLVLEGELPFQRSLASVDIEQYFQVFPAQDCLEEAAAMARLYILTIPITQEGTPLRIAVVPFEDRHCVFMGIHHLFSTLDGFRVAARDLWRVYGGAELDANRANVYQDLCLEYASRFLDEALVKRHLDYWEKNNHHSIIPELEVRDASAERPRLGVRAFAIPGGSDLLAEYAKRNSIAPAAVALISLLEAFAPYLPKSESITVMLIVSGNRLEAGLEDEVQCYVRQLPITVCRRDLEGLTRVEAARVVTRTVLTALRFGAIAPAALPDGPARQNGLMLNFVKGIENPHKFSPSLPDIVPAPRAAPNVSEHDNDDEMDPDSTAATVQVTLGDEALSTFIVRRGTDFQRSEQVMARLETIFKELMESVQQGIDAGAFHFT